MEKITDWAARQVGGAIAIEGRDSKGRRSLRGIASIRSERKLFGSRTVATGKDGGRYWLA